MWGGGYMKNSFIQKNSVKIINKGPFGGKNRVRASKFYENTFGLFDANDYGKAFANQKNSLTNNLFKTYYGVLPKRDAFFKGLKTDEQQQSLSLAQALSLRQKGWTPDRLIMKTRDRDYVASQAKKASKSSLRTAQNEQRLTVDDFVTFLQADRIATEPTVLNNLKTKSELHDLGYAVLDGQKPVVTIDNIGFYDVSSCNNKNELFAGQNLDDLKLEVVENNQTEQLAQKLSAGFGIDITTNPNQISVVVYKGVKGRVKNIFRRARKFFTKLNTGFKSPIKNKISIENKSLKSTSDVAKFIKRVSDFAVIDAYQQYEKFVLGDETLFERFEQNRTAMEQVSANMLAESLCRMGVLSKNDANIMSKYFKLNTIYAMHNLKDKSSDMLSQLFEMHSVLVRRVANSLNLNLADYAYMSNVEFDMQNDKFFDDVLCKKSRISENDYINFELQSKFNKKSNTEEKIKADEKTKESKPAVDKKVKDFVENLLNPGVLMLKSGEQTNQEQSQQQDQPEEQQTTQTDEILKHFNNKFDTDEIYVLKTDKNSVIDTEEDSTMQSTDVKNDSTMQSDTEEQNDNAELNNSAQNENNVHEMVKDMLAKATVMLPEGKKPLSLEQAEPQLMLKEGQPVLAQDVQDQTINQNHVLNEKLETTYKESDDYGYQKISLYDGEDLISSKITDKKLLQVVSETIVKPAMSNIMHEFEDKSQAEVEDDLCVVIRKYRKLMEMAQLSDEEKQEATYEFLRSIDKMERMGETEKQRLQSITKAFNVFKLTKDIATDIKVYKKATPELEKSKSITKVYKNYILEHGDIETVRGEVQELIKDEILCVDALDKKIAF